MHKNSKAYKAKAAALVKARAARKHKRTATPVTLTPTNRYKDMQWSTPPKPTEPSDYVRTANLLWAAEDGKSLTVAPNADLRVVIRERLETLILAELDALLG